MVTSMKRNYHFTGATSNRLPLGKDCCPACRQKLPESELIIVSSEHRFISRFGIRVSLEAQEIKIMDALNKDYPNIVDAERLFIKLYGYDSDATLQTMRTRISLLRKKIYPLGIIIQNARQNAGGYCMLKLAAPISSPPKKKNTLTTWWRGEPENVR